MPRNPVEATAISSIFSHPGVVAACACADRTAVFEMGDRQYTGEFNGVIAVRFGKPSVNKAASMTVPLHIVGYSTQSQIEGLGATSLDFDYSRPVRSSDIKGAPETFFPAVQTMRLNILMTAEALGNVTLRSMNPGTLVNGKVGTFPPTPGATYVLQKAVESRGREATWQGQGAPGQREHPHHRHGDAVEGAEGRLRGALPPGRGGQQSALPAGARRQGRVEGLHPRGVEVATLLKGALPAGRHKAPVDRAKLTGKNLHYQLFLDGKASSAPMPL